MDPSRFSKLPSLATGAALFLPALSYGQARLWNNFATGATEDWNTGANWAAPSAPDSIGESAVFGEPIPFPGLAHIIDFSVATTLDSISWSDNDSGGPNGSGFFANAPANATAMRLTGNDVTLDAGADALDLTSGAFAGLTPPAAGSDTYRVQIENNLTFTNATTINVSDLNSTVTGNMTGNITLTGEVRGTEDITKTGGGFLDFEGSVDNPWSGKFIQDGGSTRLNMDDGDRSIPGDLGPDGVLGNVLAFSSQEVRLESGSLVNVLDEQISDTAVISFQNDGGRETYNLNGNEETIANWGGGNSGTGNNPDRLDLGSNAKASSILNFGADDEDSSFAGDLRRDGILNKSGTGTWTLTGGDLTGPDIDINILDGTFQMNGNHDENVGTYTIDGDMTGTGNIDLGTVIINANGTLNAGTQQGASNLTDCLHDINQPATTVVTNQFETLEIKNLTLMSGSVTTFDINTSADIDAATAAFDANIAATVAAIGAAPFPQLDADDEYDQIVSDMGTLTLSSGSTIIVNPVSFVPARGMVYDLFSGFSSIVDNGFDAGPTYRSGSQSALFDLVLPELTSFGTSGGLRWDTSLFLSHGTLVIVPEPSRAVLLLGGFLMVLARRRR